MQDFLCGAGFAGYISNLIMENNTDQNKKTVFDTTVAIKHTDMPVKTPATDTVKNTAEDEGLNQASTENNDLEPGTTSHGDD